MPLDLITRLGSRAMVPGDERTGREIADYVELMVRPGVPQELDDLLGGRSRSFGRLDPVRVRALARALADPPGAEFNRVRLGAAAGVPPTTLPPYVDLLVQLGVVALVPGCRSPVARRAIGRPRLVFTDVAVARHLAGCPAPDLVAFSGRRLLAPLLRNLVAAELLRQQAESAAGYRISHLRERNGLAVDLVVELPDDTLYGIEVRTAASLRPHQFDGLRALRTRAGGRFRGGIVLNTAPTGHVYGPRLWSLPIATLWEG